MKFIDRMMRVMVKMSGSRVVQVRNNQPCTEVVGGKTCHFRSKLEYRYARYLEILKTNGYIVEWKYEPFRYAFPNETTGAKVYTPDFLVAYGDRYEIHETKGYLAGTDITKFRRMQKYYPTVPIVLIMQSIPRKMTRSKGANRLRTAAKYCTRIVSIGELTKGVV